MPATEALLPRFRAAHTQVLGVSVDSIHCHANWAVSLGGISFPLLADFHPKGEVARSYGLYLENAGITDRATVVLDAGGTVRHVSSVSPSGERDIGALAAICEEVDAGWEGDIDQVPVGTGIPTGAALYVKSRCGFSLRALNARTNLHLEHVLPVFNVTEEAGAQEKLKGLAGRDTAPCLLTGETPLFESGDIVQFLAKAATGL